ncbi:MAG: hypothetical protein WAS73_16205 [Defluviicoccus sp.]
MPTGSSVTGPKGSALALPPATTLAEIPAQTTLEPLESGDPRYVDINRGLGTRDLRRMRVCLEQSDANANRYAKIAFTGHRGCGKSTELLRMEHEISDRFTCLHLYVDETLIRDCQYSDLLLWLAHSLVEKAEELGLRAPPGLVKDVADWFAEKTLDDVKTVKHEIELEATAEAKAGAGAFGVALKLLARIRARVQGNVEQRQTIRLRLQSYGVELIERVNSLLDWFQQALVDARWGPELLIVQDNLDRLPVDVGRHLFFDHGELLKQLRAHMIFTHPIAMVLAPYRIGAVFDNCYTMPMVKVRHRDGSPCDDGLNALIDLVGRRVAIDRVFTEEAVARSLAARSGGSVRDLLRLVTSAQQEARLDGKTQIDQASADEAVKRLRLDFERLLVPSDVYFPLLAQIHRTKDLTLAGGTAAAASTAQDAREFFSQLLFNGSVLEYNGDRNWYDVHPVILDIEAFQRALTSARAG